MERFKGVLLLAVAARSLAKEPDASGNLGEIGLLCPFHIERPAMPAATDMFNGSSKKCPNRTVEDDGALLLLWLLLLLMVVVVSMLNWCCLGALGLRPLACVMGVGFPCLPSV